MPESKDTFTQFNDLLSSNMPDEYKALLKNFQEQGTFYQQLIKNVNNDDDNLASFWNLPNTLGFNSSTDEQPEWLKSIFTINGLGKNTDETRANPFHAFESAQQVMQNNFNEMQQTTSKMTALHNELSQLAMDRFHDLKGSTDNLTTEQLCAFWLQAGEEAFKQISQTDDYIETQQALLTSLSEIKGTQHELSEQVSTLFGLPSQQSLQDLQKGLHQLRLEFAEYKEQTDVVIHKLTNKLSKLK